MKVLPSEYNILTPLQSENLIRLGINKDGGYIVDGDLLLSSNFMVSFGMANEFSFEKHFLMLKNKNALIIFDFSISHFHYIKELFKNMRRILKFKRNFSDLFKCVIEYFNFINFTNKRNVNFFSKKICHRANDSKSITVKEIFEKYKIKNTTLKIDIECSEYEIIEDILFYSNYIDQIIIEFHDTHKRKNEFIEKIIKMKKFFFITHIHGNNYRNLNNDGFPINAEITFINNKFLSKKYKKKFLFPDSKLDFPNNNKIKDLSFKFSII